MCCAVRQANIAGGTLRQLTRAWWVLVLAIAVAVCHWGKVAPTYVGQVTADV